MDLNKFKLFNSEDFSAINSEINVNDLKESSIEWINHAKEDQPFIKKIGILTGTIAFFVAGAFFLNTYSQQIVSEASQKKTEYKEIDSFLTKYNKDAEEYKKSISQLHGKILSEKEIDQASVFISRLAESNGLQITNTKRNEKHNSLGNGISSQTTELSVEGSYASLLQFLSNVENADFFISVTSVEVNKSFNNMEVSSKLKAKINCDIFFTSATQSKETKKGGAEAKASK